MDGFPEEETSESSENVNPVWQDSTDGQITTPDELPVELGATVDIMTRREKLLGSISFLATLSKTSIYENIDDKPWFVRKLEKRYPDSAQQHIDEKLANRAKFNDLARADFDKAFGVNEMIIGGLLTVQEARLMADDFYNGTNKSGYNVDEEGNQKSFTGSFADKKNQARHDIRKVLEKGKA